MEIIYSGEDLAPKLNKESKAVSKNDTKKIKRKFFERKQLKRPALGLGKTEFLEARNKSSQSSRSPHSSSSIKGKSLTIGLSGIGGASVARDSSGGLVGGGIIVDSVS